MIEIAGRKIANFTRPYIVAEISGEHCGEFYKAQELIMHASDAGADAVKFQHYDPMKLAIKRGGIDKVLEDGPWKGLTLGDLYKQTYTPREWFADLFHVAEIHEITAFCSVFDEEDIPYLESFNCPAYKIASPEITDTNLIQACMKTGKPVIVSLGKASGPDILNVQGLAHVLQAPLVFLQCTSKYPCPLEEANLDVLKSIIVGNALHAPTGFSDHTQGILAPVVATALGACMIEKHLTLIGSKGWDQEFSITPAVFRAMVYDINQTSKLMGYKDV